MTSVGAHEFYADRLRWIRWAGLAGGLYALLFTLYTVVQPLGEQGRLIVGDILYIPASASAGLWAVLVLRSSSNRRLGWAWALIGLGFLSYAVGDTIWAWSELVRHFLPESPYITDVFYLLLYPLFFTGLMLYPTPRRDRLSRLKLFLDACAVVAAAAAFSWYFFIVPMLIAEPGNVARLAMDLAYPIGDLALIGALVRTYFAMPRGSWRAPLLTLLGGIGLYVTADMLYAYLNAYGLYQTGSVVDILWLFGSVSVGGAALVQHRRALTGQRDLYGDRCLEDSAGGADSHRAVRRNQQLLPYLALSASFLLLVHELTSVSIDLRRAGLLVGIILILSLIVIRQIITLAEHTRLNAQLRTLSMELERRVAERTTELAQRVEDITRLNEQIQQANEELWQIHRLKSEFVSNVSHELRTPLTAILGYTEYLLNWSDEPLTVQQSDSLGIVLANSERLLTLVNDLLETGRMESGKFSIEREVISPGPILRQLAEESRLEAGNKGLWLNVDLSDDLPVVLADSGRLAQVLNNLLSNAIKFTPAGGRISIVGYTLEIDHGMAYSTDSGKCNSLPDLADGKWLVISIQDTGIGIPPDEVPHLFSRFYRTRDAQRKAVHGAGLGLYMAKTIIDAHSGHLGVESRPGTGSTFWFALPSYEDAALCPPEKDLGGIPDLPVLVEPTRLQAWQEVKSESKSRLSTE